MIKVTSGVENFDQRCFILEQKYKVRAPSLPFTLNIAVDNLCKNEFDYYRERCEPINFSEHNIDAVPFKHPRMNEWRSTEEITISMNQKAMIFTQLMTFG